MLLARHFENRLILFRAGVVAVDLKGDNPSAHFNSPCGSIAASYSLRKYRSVLNSGLGADCPSPQSDVCLTMSQSSSSSARSDACAWRALNRLSRLYICTVPARQGVHLPQDSVMQKSMK